MYYDTKIVHKKWITHDVLRLLLEKPKSFQYTIGQAIELSIDHLETFMHFAPFTLTSKNEDYFLEIIVKIYRERNRLTSCLSELSLDSKIIISDPWDSYEYKGEGVFIAAGSGITPFIPMIRNLSKINSIGNNILIYANKEEKDIILREELSELLGNNGINVLSREITDSCKHGKIDKEFLNSYISDTNVFFYVCGPESFNDNIKGYLLDLGVDEDKIQVAH